MLGGTDNKRAVRTLLECILVHLTFVDAQKDFWKRTEKLDNISFPGIHKVDNVGNFLQLQMKKKLVEYLVTS